jgi:hypothetical protein
MNRATQLLSAAALIALMSSAEARKPTWQPEPPDGDDRSPVYFMVTALS